MSRPYLAACSHSGTMPSEIEAKWGVGGGLAVRGGVTGWGVPRGMWSWGDGEGFWTRQDWGVTREQPEAGSGDVVGVVRGARLGTVQTIAGDDRTGGSACEDNKRECNTQPDGQCLIHIFGKGLSDGTRRLRHCWIACFTMYVVES
jgi:hypothetical protein